MLSFPIDEDGPTAGPRELGDVVICPEHTEDMAEAVVHGVAAPLRLRPRDRRRRDARAAGRVLPVAVTPRRLRRARRAAERRQVDARQRPRRRQGRDRLRPARRRPAAPSAASPPRAPTGSSCWPTCPACSARATCSPSACSAAWTASSASADAVLFLSRRSGRRAGRPLHRRHRSSRRQAAG